MSRMVIDDEMWGRLEKLLPSPKGRHGNDDRLFLEAIYWILRTGAPWEIYPLSMVTGSQFITAITTGPRKGIFRQL